MASKVRSFWWWDAYSTMPTAAPSCTFLCPLPASTIIPRHPQITVHNQLAHYQNGPPKIGSKLKKKNMRKVFTEERYKNFLFHSRSCSRTNFNSIWVREREREEKRKKTKENANHITYSQEFWAQLKTHV
jgi:hypothetical protein